MYSAYYLQETLSKQSGDPCSISPTQRLIRVTTLFFCF